MNARTFILAMELSSKLMLMLMLIRRHVDDGGQFDQALARENVSPPSVMMDMNMRNCLN